MAASLGYLLDETDPSLTQGVLFEVRLELSEPDVIFVPPLDKNLVGNFYDQINGYLDDIFFGCSLIPRVAKHLDKGYETDKAKDNKISLIFFSILMQSYTVSSRFKKESRFKKDCCYNPLFST